MARNPVLLSPHNFKPKMSNDDTNGWQAKHDSYWSR